MNAVYYKISNNYKDFNNMRADYWHLMTEIAIVTESVKSCKSRWLTLTFTMQFF